MRVCVLFAIVAFCVCARLTLEYIKHTQNPCNYALPERWIWSAYMNTYDGIRCTFWTMYGLFAELRKGWKLSPDYNALTMIWCWCCCLRSGKCWNEREKVCANEMSTKWNRFHKFHLLSLISLASGKLCVCCVAKNVLDDCRCEAQTYTPNRKKFPWTKSGNYTVIHRYNMHGRVIWFALLGNGHLFVGVACAVWAV